MDSEKALKTLNVRSVWLPVIFGLGIVAIIIFTDDRINADTLSLVQSVSPIALIGALMLLAVKDGVNMFRLKTIGKRDLEWTSCLRVIMLWEFAIAVTPPLIGAAAVLVFVMYKEGLSFGKALAFTLLLAAFDNLFFLTASPLAIWASNGEVIPDSLSVSENLGQGIRSLFWLSYASIALYTSFMLSAVLLFPIGIRRLTGHLMNFKWLQKWKVPVMKQADDLVLVSQLLKGKSIVFWLSILGITYLVWILKFIVLNMLISGFVDLSLEDHGILLGKHLIMWVVLLVSPAPGNAGAAELIFPAFFEGYLKEYTFVCVLIWRLVSFYPYLLIGAIILPKWLRMSKV